MPTTGTVTGADGDSFDQFSFSNLSLDQIDGPTLSQYDTVVLMQVTTSDLTDAAKQALSQFVTNGGKLIIHDADSTTGNDYSWLPVPAQTGQSCQNCGSTSGTSQVVENNTLVSANPADASYVAVSQLEGATDAVGDANVMVTQDHRWFVDIRATNSVGDTGAVHTYATDNGLIIFNGYDTDNVGSTQDDGVDWLGKLWYLELAQGWSPDGLPHGTPVAPASPPPPPPPPPPAHSKCDPGADTSGWNIFKVTVRCLASGQAFTDPVLAPKTNCILSLGLDVIPVGKLHVVAKAVKAFRKDAKALGIELRAIKATRNDKRLLKGLEYLGTASSVYKDPRQLIQIIATSHLVLLGVRQTLTKGRGNYPKAFRLLKNVQSAGSDIVTALSGAQDVIDCYKAFKKPKPKK